MKKQLLICLAIALIIVTANAQSTQNVGFKLFGEKIDYETATIALTTINTTLTTLNLAGITPKWQSQYIQGVAVATGACQLGFGIWQARNNFTTLNLVNITAGTATIITNGFLLYKTFTGGSTPTKNDGKKSSSWNIYSSPLPLTNNKQEIGIRLVKSF